ncbi:EF-hand domain-containing protein [Antarctobacter heliothermus]|uniref:EF hand n=1 Tax=Antarctobacter heliothermus TaxID=74033 RepID=A0A239LGX0_9RHOB|nr:EF-hand domain-containing protein [Antarctobacter heliothermus]SNT28794.1 EF hand [Antarctobacter heliothermus]
MKNSALWVTGALVVVMGTAGIASARGYGDGERGPRGAGMEKMFEQIDADKDGKITKDEMEAHRTARFEAIDADGDGKLSKEEMDGARDARRLERTQKMVESLDQNDDGLLSAEELAAGGPKRGPEAMFDRLDADEDGALTLEEMQQAHGKMRDGGKHRSGGKRGEHGERGHRGGHGHGFPFFGGPDASDEG